MSKYQRNLCPFYTHSTIDSTWFNILNYHDLQSSVTMVQHLDKSLTNQWMIFDHYNPFLSILYLYFDLFLKNSVKIVLFFKRKTKWGILEKSEKSGFFFSVRFFFFQIWILIWTDRQTTKRSKKIKNRSTDHFASWCWRVFVFRSSHSANRDKHKQRTEKEGAIDPRDTASNASTAKRAEDKKG